MTKDAVLPNIVPYTVQSQLQSLIFSPDEVKEILFALPIGKATGPDEISNRVLKELSSEFSSPLCSVFNYSLSFGEVPDIFKGAHVCPAPKGGDLSIISNHRPISLVSNLAKTLERLVFKHLYNHFRENNIITWFQSGFTPGDSTVNQLMYFYNTFCQAFRLWERSSSRVLWHLESLRSGLACWINTQTYSRRCGWKSFKIVY